MPEIFIPDSLQVRIHQEVGQVIIVGLNPVMGMTWEKALEFARAITTQARKAEEAVKGAQIAFDQAFLYRAGMPLALSVDRKIQEEARKEARFNPFLRKFLPWKHGSGVMEKARIGRPAVIRHKPKEGAIDK